MDNLAPSQRRFLAIGLLISVVLVMWVAIIGPLVSFVRSSSDDRQADLRALSRDHALMAKDSDVQDALTSLAQSPRWTRFYETQKPEKATLQLETDLRELIATPNNPTSMTALPPTKRGSLVRIAAKVTLSMPINQFAEFLARLQAHSKLLQIENITIQAPDFQIANTNPSLNVQADVVGFLVARENLPK